MPDRLIRDELLDSDRYLGLTSDTARLLFVHLLLLCDDLGNTEATSRFIQRRAFASPVSDAAVDKILSELVDADLVRLYEVDGKRYAHIPRFRQRLRSVKRVNPRPPEQMECKEIRDMLKHLSDKSQSTDRQMPDTCPSLAGEGK